MKNEYARFIIILFLIVLPFSVFSQKIRFYNSEKGLPNSLLQQVSQDDQGFIWIATENGLSYFDGMRFTNFRHDENTPGSIYSDLVKVIFTDSKGVTWIGTSDGLQIFDRKRNTFIDFPMQIDSISVKLYVSSIIESNDHEKLLVSISGYGVAVYNICNHELDKESTKNLKELNSNDYWGSLFFDSKGTLFEALINDWRKQFSYSKLPFLFVQLPNVGKANKQVVESGWAEVRNAQRRALELPNTGMAVALDIGEWNDIHPLNKKEVGRRLALEAFRVAYNDSLLVSCGPLFKEMQIVENSIILTFSSVGSGLCANSLLNGFQIAGADGSYKWANAVVLSKNKVKVWSSSVAQPQFVRYAWEDNPAGANLKNKEGLPASTFCTK